MALSAGCFSQTQPPAPADPAAPPKPAAETQEPAPPEEKAAAPVDPHTYKIGAEDVLRIHVWREPELSSVVIVRPDGRITLPLLEEIDAAGMTPTQLQAKITEMLAKSLLQNPRVTVSVQEVRSKKYYITGQIGRPGPVPLVVPTTVLQAISSAGGFREFAKQKKIVIMRGDQRLKFNYKEVIQGKNMAQNILLQDGDHIIVP
ncbi:MAG: polysaccharide biosynthesis/export family protein [Bryobacterales bacterium]|nr:polysaccharide biosynthesis/export family protein [Bryobacterales bacterium]